MSKQKSFDLLFVFLTSVILIFLIFESFVAGAINANIDQEWFVYSKFLIRGPGFLLFLVYFMPIISSNEFFKKNNPFITLYLFVVVIASHDLTSAMHGLFSFVAFLFLLYYTSAKRRQFEYILIFTALLHAGATIAQALVGSEVLFLHQNYDFDTSFVSAESSLMWGSVRPIGIFSNGIYSSCFTIICLVASFLRPDKKWFCFLMGVAAMSQGSFTSVIVFGMALMALRTEFKTFNFIFGFAFCFALYQLIMPDWVSINHNMEEFLKSMSVRQSSIQSNNMFQKLGLPLDFVPAELLLNLILIISAICFFFLPKSILAWLLKIAICTLPLTIHEISNHFLYVLLLASVVCLHRDHLIRLSDTPNEMRLR